MTTSSIRFNNRLLEALPRTCAERILASASPLDLPVGTKLFERDERPRSLHLLTAGIASITFTSEDGTSVELATQGNEGLVGWAFLFGPALKSTSCHMQVGGAGYRIPLALMQRELDDVPETRQRVLEYAQHQSAAAFQVAACNRLHRAEARFARWLLMVADRLGSDDFAMTQEFMAMMVGNRRTTVAEVCARLSRAGAIEGRRGGVRLVNRGVLEARACECYRILRSNLDALYSRPLRQSHGPA